MEPKNGGLEDDFPFYINGWFLGSMLIFRGVATETHSAKQAKRLKLSIGSHV